jgi:hypothetical protein
MLTSLTCNPMPSCNNKKHRKYSHVLLCHMLTRSTHSIKMIHNTMYIRRRSHRGSHRQQYCGFGSGILDGSGTGLVNRKFFFQSRAHIQYVGFFSKKIRVSSGKREKRWVQCSRPTFVGAGPELWNGWGAQSQSSGSETQTISDLNEKS